MPRIALTTALFLVLAAPAVAGDVARISSNQTGLLITGTPDNDVVRGTTNGTNLRFTVNGASIGFDRSTHCEDLGGYTQCPTPGSVTVNAAEGNDRILMSELSVPMNIAAGAGDDRILPTTGAAGIDCGDGVDVVKGDVTKDALFNCESPATAPVVDPDDMDGDGDPVFDGNGDCDDTDPSINHSAHDAPGDGIDQNCDGNDPNLLQTGAIPVMKFKSHKGHTAVLKVRIDRLVAKSTVMVRCTGLGCPGGIIAPKFFRGGGGSAIFTKAFKDVVLKPGARLAIRVSAPDYLGTLIRYSVHKHSVSKRFTCFDQTGVASGCGGTGEGD